MADEKMTLGQAIDQVLKALSLFEQPDQQTILGAVCNHLKITLLGQQQSAPFQPPPPPLGVGRTTPPPLPSGSHFSDGRPLDIKTLKERKKPASAKQMACLIAYYLSDVAPAHERRDFVTHEDIEKYFKQAGYPQTNKMEQVLVDAKRSGYFESSVRGQYKLNPVGHNLVAYKMPADRGGE
jgi:hypothetical protein